MGALDGGMPRHDGGMRDDDINDIIDRLLDAHGNGTLPPYRNVGTQGNGTNAASSAPWLDALLAAPPALNDNAVSPWQPVGMGTYGTTRHDDMSQGSMTSMPTTSRGRLHRSGGGGGIGTRAQTARRETQAPSSVTGLLRADGLHAESSSGMARASWRRDGGGMTSGASGIGFDDLMRASGVASDWHAGDLVDDVIDDDYTIPDDHAVASAAVKAPRPAAGAGAVMTKVRPTHVLGGYDMLGGIWEGVLQGLVVFVVPIIPLAVMTLVAQNVFGLLCTSPLCVVFPVSSVALSLVGARLTKALHCDLWDRLTTPDAASSGRRGR